ncbi:MAG: thioredoxin family protein [Pseudobacter sp.]|uniref:thioredoxin family protein n=1 Tax=Pseudobacter sp. TaxID=2045420 RepID=UPI003F7FD715
MSVFKHVPVMLLLFSSITISAQENNSIQFTNGSFNEALQAAAKSGKLVFVDCYTSWCAPCKWMEKNVFVNDTIHQYFNKQFINFKVDMEKGEGVSLRERYKVTSFPTYLFVDAKGNQVHRTGSRMSVQDFITEARRANEPGNTLADMEKKFNSGDRSLKLLTDYAIVLQRVNGGQFDKVRNELISKVKEEELNTALGWTIIKNFARDEEDKLGSYLIRHRQQFNAFADEASIQTKLNQLASSTMYGLIRQKRNAEFFDKLTMMLRDTSYAAQRNAVMLQIEYYLTNKNAEGFLAVARTAQAGAFRNNPADLSFVARRAGYQANGDTAILKQAYEMARLAAQLEPEEYSNQGTLAESCYALGLKEEGLKAARKARLLADLETSKIQKIAQALVDKLEKLN